MTALILNLMFRNNAEEAVKFYIAVFSQVFGTCRILNTTRYGEKELAALRDVP